MSYESTIESLRLNGNLREIPTAETIRRFIDFSSNDYLGIAADRTLQDDFFKSCEGNIPAMTSSASRLLAADQDEYFRLESMLSELYGHRPCLLFNSGYHANTGLLSALASEPRTLIVADKLVHASMIDGIILSRAPFKRFRHNDFDQLESILAKESGSFDRIIVAVESVYSMDGDSADIDRLVAIKRNHPGSLLYVDEAHAFGAEGDRGLGLCRSNPGFDEIDVIVGTFGKAAASMGAFCVATPTIHQYAVNRSRSLIFSTAMPPITCAWTRFVISRMIEMDNERAHLRNLAQRLHGQLQEISPKRILPSPSHITPLIIGDARLTVSLSQRLLDHGLKVLPIRTPTVPPGTERLRISLSAALTTDDIDRLTNAIREEL